MSAGFFSALLPRDSIALGVKPAVRVAFDPFPIDVMFLGLTMQLFPKVLILDGRVLFGFPTAPDPMRQPNGNAFAQILGVGEKFHVTTPFQRPERFDRGEHFHAIVCGGGMSASQDLLVLSINQNRGPSAASARIFCAGAIRINGDFGQGCCFWSGRHAEM